jgi:hypothetical protein
LQPGEELLGSNGALVSVLRIVHRNKPATVYNVEVHGEHAYRVSPLGLLVHNASAPRNAGAAIDGAHHLDDFIDDLADGFQSHQRLQRSASHAIQNHHLISRPMVDA